MLILEARIRFDKITDNPDALTSDLSTKNIIRPNINFGDDLLFSGTIRTDKKVETIMLGILYDVSIEMPTIEQEAYELIKDKLNEGHEFIIQNASRVIGKGIIKDYLYE